MKFKRNIFSLLFLLFSLIAFCQEEEYDLIIENTQIIDGTGNKPYWGQVGIADGKIAFIEKDTSLYFSAKKRIDAHGKVLSPGFIDTHAHGNPLKTPNFRNFLAMGVTTICLGQDGGSPMEKNLSPWMKKVDRANPSVNIAMFVGHNTLRKLSGTNFDTIPSEEDMEEMKLLLKNAFRDGVFGMSTGLEYNPGFYAESEELRELAKVVGSQNGIIMSHMRNEDDAFLETSIKELMEQGKYCPVHISHIKSVYGKGKARAKEILQLIDSARAKGMQITADIYPYTASYTGIGILFPHWAKQPNNYEQVLKTRRAELADFLRKKVNKRNGPEATLIGSGPYKGKTLAEVAGQLKKPFEEVLIDNIGPYGASGAYFVMDKELQKTLLKHPVINICSDGSPSMNHPRGYGSFAKIIESFVLEEQLLSLEEAVHKMTGLPAKTLGLKERGLIKEGFKADILLFDPSEVKANATYENPHHLATGFETVIVNGKIAKNDTEFTKNGYGEVLKKK
ncbi:MAG TPA: amidohydrolase family protein [Salinimicrobium sp.]|nr:amidohydrolase family protein [Salinimicrobium sp.]